MTEKKEGKIQSKLWALFGVILFILLLFFGAGTIDSFLVLLLPKGFNPTIKFLIEFALVYLLIYFLWGTKTVKSAYSYFKEAFGIEKMIRKIEPKFNIPQPDLN